MNDVKYLTVVPKDEGKLPRSSSAVVSRVQDILSDVTKHDEIIDWRITKVVKPT